MGRKLKVFGLIAIMLALMVGCGSSKLSDSYSEDELRVASEEVIANMNQENYVAVLEGGSNELKGALDAQKLEEAWDMYSDRGEFEEISKMSFVEKDGYGLVVAIAEYENKKIQFTLSYNPEMELSGFWVK